MHRKDRKTKRREDVIKAIAKQAEAGQPIDVEKVADLAGMTAKAALTVLGELASLGWVEPTRDGWTMTEAGQEHGRQLIRAHRVYESHLAEHSGLDPEDWHAKAERAEHVLQPEEVDALLHDLNHPHFDPHGDAIPTRAGDMPRMRGQLLSAVAEAGTYAIIHVEDEPREPFSRLVRAGIAAGIVVEVEPLNQGRFVIRWAGLEKKVTPEEAAAISVEPFQEDAARPLPTGNLGALRDGQQGEVFGLSPAIRGLERRRLLDLGFVPGSRVVREGSGFLNGPVRFRVRGTVQAIRPEQSKKIFLK